MGSAIGTAEAPNSAEAEERDFVAIGLKYATDIVTGAIPACKFVQQACQRQLDDLEREKNDPSWPWKFDEEKAARICIFVELMPHIKGEFANRHELIRLEPWQCFVLTVIFGWVHKDDFACDIPECKHTGGMRRFTEAYIEVPRGNGKSTLLAPIGLFMLAVDGEEGAEVYSAATKHDQAKIVWGMAKQMAKKTPRFLRKYGIEIFAGSISQPSSASKYTPLSQDFNTMDGLNIHCGVVDELHAHKTAGTYNVLKTGSRKRLQALLAIITTAGFNRAGVCYILRGYILRILNHVLDYNDPGVMRTFGIVYTIDDDDDPWTVESLIKANPNWMASIDRAGLVADMYKAKATPAQQNNFLTKHLNVWVGAERTWMDMVAWDSLADPSLKLEDFIGKTAIDGLDLATRTDLAAKATIFPLQDHCTEPETDEERQAREDAEIQAREAAEANGEDYIPEAGERTKHWCIAIFSRAYAPQSSLENSPNSDSYAGWAKEGWLAVNQGNTIDYDDVEADVLEDQSAFDLWELAVDPHNATQLTTRLAKQEVRVVEVPPSTGTYSEPMKELLAMVLEGHVHHCGDPALTWAMANVVERRDTKDNVYPIKDSEDAKIDPAIAVITAMNRFLAWLSTETESVYSRRGLITF